MDIRQLQYFLALSKQEHMSLTAEFLGISQPALSKSIRNLEKELGTELFDRHGNHIKLNQNGQEFAEYASRILNDLEMGRRALYQSRFDYRGTIRISCHVFADSIMDCITDYMKLNPQFRVSLFQSPEGDERMNDKIDFILGVHGAGGLGRDWVSQPLFKDDAYILISPRYREYPSEITSLSPAGLKEDVFISDYIASELFSYTDLIHHMCSSAGFRPKILFSTDDFLSKIRMVGEGCGITVLPGACLRTVHQLYPDIRAFRIEHFSFLRIICLMRKKESQLSEVGKDFWNFAEDYYWDGGNSECFGGL